MNNFKLRRNLNIWERKIFSISLVALYYNIQRSVDWSNGIIVEINTNRYIYIYVPRYDVLFRSQCLKQWKNQFSNTQRSVTTVGCNELRWTSVSFCHLFLFFKCPTPFEKPSAVCVLWLLSAYIQLSLWKTSGEKKNKIFIEHGRLILTY